MVLVLWKGTLSDLWLSCGSLLITEKPKIAGMQDSGEFYPLALYWTMWLCLVSLVTPVYLPGSRFTHFLEKEAWTWLWWHMGFGCTHDHLAVIVNHWTHIPPRSYSLRIFLAHPQIPRQLLLIDSSWKVKWNLFSVDWIIWLLWPLWMFIIFWFPGVPKSWPVISPKHFVRLVATTKWRYQGKCMVPGRKKSQLQWSFTPHPV